MRKTLSFALKEEMGLDVKCPGIIHSTFLRFRRNPDDIKNFIEMFESIAKKFKICETIIDEILLTSETMPYMTGGETLHQFCLR